MPAALVICLYQFQKRKFSVDFITLICGLRGLGLPATLAELKYSTSDVATLAGAAHRSYFNLSAPFHPAASQYATMISASLAPVTLAR